MGDISVPLAVPGDVYAALVAHEVGWRVDIGIPGPDARFSSGYVQLGRAGVERVLGALRAAILTLESIDTPSLTAQSTRTLGSDLDVKVQASSRGGHISIGAMSATSHEYSRALNVEEATTWVRALESALSDGPALVASAQPPLSVQETVWVEGHRFEVGHADRRVSGWGRYPNRLVLRGLGPSGLQFEILRLTPNPEGPFAFSWTNCGTCRNGQAGSALVESADGLDPGLMAAYVASLEAFRRLKSPSGPMKEVRDHASGPSLLAPLEKGTAGDPEAARVLWAREARLHESHGRWWRAAQAWESANDLDNSRRCWSAQAAQSYAAEKFRSAAEEWDMAGEVRLAQESWLRHAQVVTTPASVIYALERAGDSDETKAMWAKLAHDAENRGDLTQAASYWTRASLPERILGSREGADRLESEKDVLAAGGGFQTIRDEIPNVDPFAQLATRYELETNWVDAAKAWSRAGDVKRASRAWARAATDSEQASLWADAQRAWSNAGNQERVTNAVMERAGQLEADGRWHEASKLWSQLGESERSQTASARALDQLEREGKWRKAADGWKNLDRTDRYDLAMEGHAQQFEQRGRWYDAALAWASIGKSTRSMAAWSEVAAAKERRGDYEGAVEAWTKAGDETRVVKARHDAAEQCERRGAWSLAAYWWFSLAERQRARVALEREAGRLEHQAAGWRREFGDEPPIWVSDEWLSAADAWSAAGQPLRGTALRFRWLIEGRHLDQDLDSDGG